MAQVGDQSAVQTYLRQVGQRSIILIILVFGYQPTHAQQTWDWVQPFVSGVASDIVTDSAGNTYATHFLLDTVSFAGIPWQPGQMGTIAKYDPDGQVIWAHTSSQAYYDVVTLKGNMLFATGHAWGPSFTIGGQSWTWAPSYPQAQALVISAFTLDGTMMWTELDTVYGGATEVFDIEINDSNEVFLAMKFNGSVWWNGTHLYSGSSVPTLVKRSPDGRKLWYAQPYIGTTSAKGATNGVAALSDGGAVIIGYFLGDTCMFDTILLTRSGFFLSRVDAQGNFLWARGGAGAWGYDVDRSLDDSLFLAGTIFSDTIDALLPFEPVTIGYDVFLAKAGMDGGIGRLHTSTALSPSSSAQMSALTVGSDGTVYMAGMVRDGTVLADDTLTATTLFLEKLTENGQHLWNATMLLTEVGKNPHLEVGGVGSDSEGRGYVSGTVRYSDLAYNDTTISLLPDWHYLLVVGRTELAATAIEQNGRPAIQVFPNPTNALICIQNRPQGSLVTFWDIRGCRVEPTRIDANTYDMGALTAGVYFLRLKSDSHKLSYRIVLLR